MRPLQDELLSFTTPARDLGSEFLVPNPHERYYAAFHYKLIDQYDTELIPFVRSNMDELRLLEAERYATSLLTLTHHQDAAAFRAHVLRRETLQEMAYEKQRDHTAHTLYNYLLGWYVFSHSRIMEDALRPHFLVRYGSVAGFTDTPTVYHNFGNIWSFVSLLHDVGYAFEGSLKKGDPKRPPIPVRDAAAVVETFFASIFAGDGDPELTHMATVLKKLTGTKPPKIGVRSLGDVSDSLRKLGDLSALWGCALDERDDWRRHGTTPPGPDAFAVWQDHYRQFGNHGMADRMRDLEITYKYQYEKELPGVGIRILDHGVIGGLMLLAHSTLYYRIVMSLKRLPPGSSPRIERIKQHFDLDPASETPPYEAEHWWAGIVWATAAVALHNIQQTDPWPGISDGVKRQLLLNDDPLAYLGILVDVLQEWDRPKSARGQFFKGQRPVSSRDCQLGASRGKILVSYGSAAISEKVGQNLDTALAGWKDVVELR